MAEIKRSQKEVDVRLPNGRVAWKVHGAPSDLSCNVSVSSLLPSAEFGECITLGSCFGLFSKGVASNSREFHTSFLKGVSVDVVGQTPRDCRLVNLDDSSGVKRSSTNRMLMKCEKVSLGMLLGSARSGRNLDAMIKAGRLDHISDAKPSADIPLPSTSGRMDGEFWKQRRGRYYSGGQPFGMLYASNNQDGLHSFCELPQGKTLEENIIIDQNHSVSTGFEKGNQLDERSIRLSTSHKLGVKHMLATQYATDLKGGMNFTINSSHSFQPDCTLCSSLFTNSSGESNLELEVLRERKRGNQEVLESIMTNLTTGDKLLKLQSRSSFMKGVVFVNSVISNLRGQHAFKFMATTPLWKSISVTNSLSTDLHGNEKFCMNAMQKIHDHILIGAAYTTNLKCEDSLSVEAKHELDGLRNVVLKLTKDLGGSAHLDLMSSVSFQRNFCLCRYRYLSMERQSLGLEWRHEISPEHYISVQALVKDCNCRLSTEFCLPC